jgi:hypothetical protein
MPGGSKSPLQPLDMVPFAISAQDGQVLAGFVPLAQVTLHFAPPCPCLVIGGVSAKQER